MLWCPATRRKLSPKKVQKSTSEDPTLRDLKILELHTQRMDGQEKCDLTGIQTFISRTHNSGRSGYEGR